MRKLFPIKFTGKLQICLYTTDLPKYGTFLGARKPKGLYRIVKNVSQ